MVKSKLGKMPSAVPGIVACLLACLSASAEETNVSGEQLYHKQCMECHGASGDGVEDEYEQALVGDWSIGKLARYVAKNMPEENPKQCVAEDAEKVSQYLYHAFYSMEARARNNPPRLELAHLTNRQYRETIADLVRAPSKATRSQSGLQASYFDSKGMNKKNALKHKRVERKIDFAFGNAPPVEGMNAEQFSIVWEGSLNARESGMYEFRISTPNGVRLYLNAPLKPGDRNLRDDTSAESQHPLVDSWVSSGNKVRVETAKTYLLGGRSYPIRIDFFKYKEKTASIRFEWKPANGAWEVPSESDFMASLSPRVMVTQTPFPPDDHSLGYDRGATVSKEWLRAVTDAAFEVGNEVEDRLTALSGVGKTTPNRVSRLKKFTTEFAERAFRRPLAEKERQGFDALFDETEKPELAVKRGIMRTLKSPYFLYPDLPHGITPEAYRTISRLALNMWDSAPDEKLFALARAGRIQGRDQLKAQAKRMLDDPRTRTKVLEFFHHWLGTDVERDLLKDKKSYPEFDENTIADMRHSLNLFLETLTWSESSDYRKLLLSNKIQLNGRLAKLFPSKTVGGGFESIDFDPKRRAGILTHPYVLTAYAYPNNSSPIHRGVFLTRNLLGRTLKPPPKATPFRSEDLDPKLSIREMVAEITKHATCMGCHRTINPLGFSLENYDAIGRWRSTENNKPVNAKSEYENRDGRFVRLSGARSLAEFAVNDEGTQKAFIQKLFQYLTKQPVEAYGPKALSNLHDHFTKSDFNIKSLIIEIVCLGSMKGVQAEPT